MKVPKDEKPRSKSVSNNLYSFFNIFFHTARLGAERNSPIFTHAPSFFVVGVGGMLANIFQDEQCNWLYEGPFSNKIFSVYLFKIVVMRLGFLKVVVSLIPARQPSMSLAFCKSTLHSVW